MNKYEFRIENIALNGDETNMMMMGMAPPEVMDTVNERLVELINKLGEDGWEALYPFSLPFVWFRKVSKKTKKSI